jgi:hypothetical protein
LSLSDGTILDYSLGTNSDLIAVTGGTVTGSNDPGGITLNITPTTGFGPGDYDLITGNAFSNFNTADFVMGDPAGDYTYNFNFDNSTLMLDVTADPPDPVPDTESTLSAMLIGVAILLAVVHRRRIAGSWFSGICCAH